MDPSLFEAYRKLVYEHSGISIKDGKQAMVSSRVHKRMRKLSIKNERSYLRYVKNDESGEELINLLDVISTNTTHFFREDDHFKQIREIMESWIEEGQRRYRVWSTASSSGEEPYTLAMTLHQVAVGRNLDIKILATDICTEALETAREGVYEAEKVESVPATLRKKYFTRLRGGGEEAYRIKEALRKMIVYKRLNLARPPFPMQGPLDIVLCRNVMIYFDSKVRRELIKSIYDLLKPGGYLFVGKSEGLMNLESRFQVVRPSVYVK